MFRKSRLCPNCKGRQYLRTSYRGKAGTWRCIVCGRVDKKGEAIFVDEEIILAAKCKDCGESLRVNKEYDSDDRIPYCLEHGKVFV